MSTIVPEELPCVACGYALRGLPADGACPECGMSVRRSLSGDQLWAADPKWLGRIVRGQWLVACGMFLSVVAALAVAFTIIAMLVLTVSDTVENVVSTVMAGVALLVPAGLCVTGVGVFQMMAQEGREIERESLLSARNLARMSVLGAPAMAVVVIWLNYQMLGSSWGRFIEAACRVALIAIVTIGAMALLSRLETLVRRAQDEILLQRIERERKFIRWAVPAAGTFLLLLPIGPGRSGGPLDFLYAALGCVGVLAMFGLLFTVAYLTDIMRRSSQLFRWCLLMARETSDIRAGKPGAGS